jgi:hypothetical protein
MKRAVLAALFLLFLPSASPQLGGVCFEPSDPTCLMFGDTMKNDQSAFALCRIEVQGFVKQVRDYQSCVNDAANTKVKKIIERFNCYARGESLCL